MTIYWPALVGGAVTCAVSAVWWRHREGFSSAVDHARRKTYGETFARKTRVSAKWNAGVPAVGAGGIGLLLIVASLSGLDW